MQARVCHQYVYILGRGYIVYSTAVVLIEPWVQEKVKYCIYACTDHKTPLSTQVHVEWTLVSEVGLLLQGVFVHWLR